MLATTRYESQKCEEGVGVQEGAIMIARGLESARVQECTRGCKSTRGCKNDVLMPHYS